jgi:hypothetical protein
MQERIWREVHQEVVFCSLSTSRREKANGNIPFMPMWDVGKTRTQVRTVTLNLRDKKV